MKSNLVDIAGVQHAETEKAILFSDTADKKDAAAPDAGDHQSDPDYIQAMQMAKKHARLILFQLEDVKTREAREGDEGEPGEPR